jgi:hypothetical protein
MVTKMVYVFITSEVEHYDYDDSGEVLITGIRVFSDKDIAEEYKRLKNEVDGYFEEEDFEVEVDLPLPTLCTMYRVVGILDKDGKLGHVYPMQKSLVLLDAGDAETFIEAAYEWQGQYRIESKSPDLKTTKANFEMGVENAIRLQKQDKGKQGGVREKWVYVKGHKNG